MSLVVSSRTLRAAVNGFLLAGPFFPAVLERRIAHCLACLAQRGCGSRRRHHQRHPLSAQTSLGLAQLAGDKLLHAGELVFGWRIIGKKFLRQADRAQRKAHRFLDAFVVRQRDLATAAAYIDQKASALRAGFAHHPAVDQACLFEAGDDLDFPTGFRFHPGKKGLRVASIAQG